MVIRSGRPDQGNNYLAVGLGNDYILGMSGDDWLTGNDGGNDILPRDEGKDELLAGNTLYITADDYQWRQAI